MPATEQPAATTYSSPLPHPTAAPAGQVPSTIHTSPLRLTTTTTPPRFTIEGPLTPGDRVIGGQGPAGVPVVVVDVSLAGAPLGSGLIKKDGSFSIEVSEPLIVNHRVGLQLGALSEAGIEPDEAEVEQILSLVGEESMNLPRIGILLTTKVVRLPSESTPN